MVCVPGRAHRPRPAWRRTASPPRCCPSCSPCTGWSRTSSITSTCTTTRWPCSTRSPRIERDPVAARPRRTRRRRSRRCCASRSPTSSRAGRRCASPRCCTTRPSPGRAARGPAGGRVPRPRPGGRGGRPRGPAPAARVPAALGYVAALCLHHLRVGFLVHERPLGRRAVWRYLKATEPWSADVTVFTVADRLATRGRNAEPAIAGHLEVARELLGHALAPPNHACAAAARRRAGARARRRARPGPRRPARPARGGPLRRRDRDARGRAPPRPRAGRRALTASQRRRWSLR